MATGVPEREVKLNKLDLELLQEAFKKQEFRKMVVDFCDELRNPENQALYQKEMTQYEKEHGSDITFINPKAGYVIKTSVAGDRKAFINICSNENVAKPSCSVKIVNGTRGLDWQVPYSLATPRDDVDKNSVRCVVYDVVFHPDTLRLAQNNERFRQLVCNTAFDALEKNYGVDLDKKNCRFPKMAYKGFPTPNVIRKKDPNFKPENIDNEGLSPEMLEKLYPQKSHTEDPPQPPKPKSTKQPAKRKEETKTPYTIPKYVIKQQKDVDIQDFTNDNKCKIGTAIPSKIVVEINLPLISSTSDCILDVKGKHLSLVCEKPSRYKLNITLPYLVNDEDGGAKFDKSKRLLIVTLPVVNTYKSAYVNSKDSGVESEENSSSYSDEDNHPLVSEVTSKTPSEDHDTTCLERKETLFLNPNLCYILPSYTFNLLENILAYTFHIKNAEPDSVVLKKYNDYTVHLKFTSIGTGFVPIHYAVFIKFDNKVEIETTSAEAWDNNVILQIEFKHKTPVVCEIGVDENNLEKVELGENVKEECNNSQNDGNELVKELAPIVEVCSSSQETNIMVTSNDCESDFSNDSEKEKRIVWIETNSSEGNKKSILRKTMSRSISESSVGDVASSADYISSDCIPEEGSLKKTVRFSDVIAKNFYRYNSSIEGQKKKNQRKKMKKRKQERRKSESEAEDDSQAVKKDNLKKEDAKPKVEKERRDSGVADTSDTDAETKKSSDAMPSPKSKPLTCDTIKHSREFYDPEKLNKGQYLEVNFKNELIFDLDM